jgi:hypothetical protein
MTMSTPSDPCPCTIVTACLRADGTPTFAVTEVTVTAEQRENGVHYYLAEADLLLAGYEEPFVNFDDSERPAFLLPAVQEYLGQAPDDASLATFVHSKEH